MTQPSDAAGFPPQALTTALSLAARFCYPSIAMNRTGPGKKPCKCGHGRAAHHLSAKRHVCWYPGCKCKDYTPAGRAASPATRRSKAQA